MKTNPSMLFLLFALAGCSPALTQPGAAVSTGQEQGVSVTVENQPVVLTPAFGHGYEGVGEVLVLVRNRDSQPLEWFGLTLRWGAKGETKAKVWELGTPVRVEPGGEARHKFRIRGHDPEVWQAVAQIRIADGDPTEVSCEFQVANPALTKAKEECEACSGIWGHPRIPWSDGCNCRTSDAGRVCHDGTECQGYCMFKAWECQPAKGPSGGPVQSPEECHLWRAAGECSERIRLYGCPEIVPRGASQAPPVEGDRPLQAPYICID